MVRDEQQTDAPLRIGLLLGQMTVDAWVTEIVDYVQSHDQLQFGLIALNGAKQPTPKPRTLWERWRSNHALYDRLMHIDGQRAAANGWADEEVDLTDKLNDIPAMSIMPCEGEAKDGFSANDIEAVRTANLDILLDLGIGGFTTEVINAARYGVWRYHHGDTDHYVSDCPGFWEVYDNSPISGITLHLLEGSERSGRPLSKTFVRTHPTSPMINLARQHSTGTILFEREVERILRTRPTAEEFRSGQTRPVKSIKPSPASKPTNQQMLMFSGRALVRSLAAKLTGKNRPVQWSIGVWPHDTTSLDRETIEDIDWYVPRPDHFVADPCAVERDGKLHLFVEEYLYNRQLGHLSVMEYDRETGFTEPRKILELDCHLSFPYVFEDDGTYYMIPEQLQSGQVVLYRCEDFPDLWVRDCVLLDNFHGADTVVFRHEGLYWMFTTNGRAGNWDSNLHLMMSKDLRGPYEPHPQTPVRITLYGSRMAGSILNLNGRLIRPGQNCVNKYGGSLILHEITSLTPDRYEERVIGEVRPNPTDLFGEALHTISMLPNQTIVDGLRYV